MTTRYAKDQPHGFTNRIERVAIVGAGGQIGKVLAEHLLKNEKHVVTVITRPSSTNKLPEGLQVSRVDYTGEDDTALVEVLRGQQVLIISMSVHAPRDSVSKLVHAAAKAAVPYVMPNWFGHDANNDALCNDSILSLIRDNSLSEIKSLGVSSYLLLVCNLWYEFSLGGGPDRFGFDFNKRTFVEFGDGNISINTTTWSQCGRAVASLLSLKELPEDETDQSPTLSQFRNNCIYISSFRLTQRDMFKSVKRTTNTTDADWTITRESAEQRWREGREAVKQGDWKPFVKVLYSRIFFPNGGGDYQSKRGLDNTILNLPVEDLDEATAIGIQMGMSGDVPFSH
ncbi:uncharacterized protein F4822DRAFT_415557 [Hypoxylon trugodes]|uniref:uncharacterized protein n=1 Tax=Hypoxylon trugodes TaxID=326681 RepID=UPI00218FC71B|nr:uncharacterized protein F4822DRAFT_415557 [Hypoxylon trugodes]KAI1384553.1 hypothetical protein F4822DRAFT_415557 [Hypoxylon trugodes]